jgi:hypothetical protein
MKMLPRKSVPKSEENFRVQFKNFTEKILEEDEKIFTGSWKTLPRKFTPHKWVFVLHILGKLVRRKVDHLI